MSSWIILIFSGYRFSLASPTQKCACKYELQAVCWHDPATVSVPCPTMAGEELTFTLLKDEQGIHIQMCNYTNNTLDCESSSNADLVLREANASFRFVLTGEMAKNGGLYTCEGMVRFPPPFKTEMSAVRILVHVEGRKCSSGETKVGNGHLWICIPVLGILCIYSIIVTIIAVINRANVRQSNSQNEYINTKPRVTSQRRRERAFRNTPRQHF
ncbi:T-cell-specific surface glycoprotein CD28 homolog [Vanacampus margaritifer]